MFTSIAIGQLVQAAKLAYARRWNPPREEDEHSLFHRSMILAVLGHSPHEADERSSHGARTLPTRIGDPVREENRAPSRWG